MAILTQKSVLVSGGVVNEGNIDKSLEHLESVCDVLVHVMDVTAPILRKHFTSWPHHLNTALKTFDAKTAVLQSGDLGFIQKVGKMTELKTKITDLVLEWINFVWFYLLTCWNFFLYNSKNFIKVERVFFKDSNNVIFLLLSILLLKKILNLLINHFDLG